MAAVLRRSPAKRRGQSTQITATDLFKLQQDPFQQDSPRARRKSDTSIVPTVFQIWRPAPALPNIESSHILDELVRSEVAYVEELKSIYSTIIRPMRSRTLFPSTIAPKVVTSPASAPSTPKKHGRTGSLFGLWNDKEGTSPSTSQLLAERLRDPMQPESDHLDRAFWSVESMVKSHSAMLSAFMDSKSPHQLISAFMVHAESLLLVYRAFVLTLPYISNSLPVANDSLPNKLSGYSRFLSPMQRSIKYELLLRRLTTALCKEAGSIELQKLARAALSSAQSFCQTLESAQKREQAKIHLGELSSILGVDVRHKTLLYEGPVTTEALSSKKGCKINFGVLFTDGTVFWNSTPLDQERPSKSWSVEAIVRIEDGGCLDLVVHTTLQKSDKVKSIRRAVGIPAVLRPLSTFVTSPEKKGPIITSVVEIVMDAKGEKRSRKETILEDWLTLGRVKEKERNRFSLESSTVVSKEDLRERGTSRPGFF